MRLRSKDFRTRDIYIDYPFEQAKFRWERETATRYRRFYGEPEVRVGQGSELFAQAVLSGREISREEYFAD